MRRIDEYNKVKTGGTEDFEFSVLPVFVS